VSELHHHIDHIESLEDISTWEVLLASWNGVSVVQSAPTLASSVNLFTDASHLGFGAVFGKKWMLSAWPCEVSSSCISFLELFAIVAALFMWGEELLDKHIIFHTDNSTLVHIWRTGSCRNKNIMRLILGLFRFSARLNLKVIFTFVPGKYNSHTDLLSRLQVDSFCQKFQSAHSFHSTVSQKLGASSQLHD